MSDRLPYIRIVIPFLERSFPVIVILSFATLHLLNYQPPPVSDFYFWAGENGNIASNIVQGKGFANPYPQVETGPSAWVAPLLPYLLASIFWIAGTRTAAAAQTGIYLQCLLYAGSLWLIYRIVRDSFSVTAARIAVLVWLIDPTRLVFTSRFLTEASLSSFTLLLAIFALMRFKNAPTWRAASTAGLAIGLAILCLPVMVLALPFYAYSLYALTKTGQIRPWLAPTLACAICLGVLTPWIVRNYVVFGEVVFIKSNFGKVLYAGNNDRGSKLETYTYSSRSERELFQSMGELAYMRYSYQRAVAWIITHKEEYQLKAARRVGDFWIGPEVIHRRFFYLLLYLSSLVGLWRYWRRNPVTILCSAILMIVPNIYYLTGIFDADRIRLPFEAILVMFGSTVFSPAVACQGLNSVASRRTRRRTDETSARDHRH